VLKKILLSFLFLVLLFMSFAHAEDAWLKVQKTGEFRWGADTAGGAPYVFFPENDPQRLIGFEIEIVEKIAKKLGVKAVLVPTPWEQLVSALNRGNFDVVFNGLEMTEPRKQVVSFSSPYYFLTEQLTVQKKTKNIKSVGDLENKKVGTMSASLAQRILEQDPQITVVTYPGPVEVYKDLEIGRIDAALLDTPIAQWYVPHYPNLINVGVPIGEGLYAAAFRKDSPILEQKINQALKELIDSGEIKKIYQKWNMWDKNQEKLKTFKNSKNKSSVSLIIKYVPLLLQGAAMTLLLSFVSMKLAVWLGLGLCLGKLYGKSFIKIFCFWFIEIIRGTPLLIQLYLLYYGLPNLGIQLNAFMAAILGMGINYAAYEAEIYRAGLLAIPKGQFEAAKSLGLSHTQTLRHVIVPQAIKIILPPSTNDFIALFKDTSLVSIITVFELTRAYNLSATTSYRFLELGLLTALLYFLMSFPLSLWSRKMEEQNNVTAR
jgi:polar amino acid transport system substrate-binding protein